MLLLNNVSTVLYNMHVARLRMIDHELRCGCIGVDVHRSIDILAVITSGPPTGRAGLEVMTQRWVHLRTAHCNGIVGCNVWSRILLLKSRILLLKSRILLLNYLPPT